MSRGQALSLIQLFKEDLPKYHFILIDKYLLSKAEELLLLYGENGLRTLDVIQLATVVLKKADLNIAKTSDVLLQKLLTDEVIPV